jgi:hypothetical protein
VQHAAAREAQQVVLADRLGAGDAVARQALGNALAGQARLRRLDVHERAAGEGALKPECVSVAELPLGHRCDDSRSRGRAGALSFLSNRSRRQNLIA